MTDISSFYITETPRDAMQGWSKHIPTQVKADYINKLLKCGFDYIDAGSFVSPKVIPQLADTSKVFSLLQNDSAKTKLMAIIGNIRGGKEAIQIENINTIGYPFSISEIFLKQNLHTNTENAIKTMLELQEMAFRSNKSIRIYISMAFGNPYGELWNDEIVLQSLDVLSKAGFIDIVFSDTTNEATPEKITRLCNNTIQTFPNLQLGLHLHTRHNDTNEKLEAAVNAGIFRFESAVGGYGGCPMTGSDLISNLNTADLLHYLNSKGIPTGIDEIALNSAVEMAAKVFE